MQIINPLPEELMTTRAAQTRQSSYTTNTGIYVK